MEKNNSLKTQQGTKNRQRNSLPPFLMVRSGFWGACVLPALTGVVTCLTPYQDGRNPQFYLWLTLTGILTLWAGQRTYKLHKKALDDIQSIQYEMSEYVKNPEYTLDLSQARNFPQMTSVLVRHITKHNPGVFDRFITNPKSIPDNEAMQDIISAYLKKHADDAPRILKALEQIKITPGKVQYGVGENEPHTIENADGVLPVSYELRKRLERCARRAKMAEICH